MGQSAARCGPHRLDVLVNERDGKPCWFGSLAVVVHSTQSGESDCVGVARCDPMDTSSRAADEDGDLSLHRRGLASLVCEPVVLTVDGDGFAGKQPAQCDHRLFESSDSRRRSVEGDACSVVLGLGVASTDAELHATVAQQIESGDVSGEQ
ncbi:MAG TPA: hypothetical protein VFI46_04545 [Jiangellaceae bacterium]|nr:hypothetical protein [Jiangellaceae bacterium]